MHSSGENSRKRKNDTAPPSQYSLATRRGDATAWNAVPPPPPPADGGPPPSAALRLIVI